MSVEEALKNILKTWIFYNLLLVPQYFIWLIFTGAINSFLCKFCHGSRSALELMFLWLYSNKLFEYFSSWENLPKIEKHINITIDSLLCAAFKVILYWKKNMGQFTPFPLRKKNKGGKKDHKQSAKGPSRYHSILD